MKSTTTEEKAAEWLTEARRMQRPCPRLPELLRPNDVESALTIQSLVTSSLGESIGGWKCSLPKAEKIVAAPIYTPAIQAMSPCLLCGQNGSVAIEPEIAFVLGHDLPVTLSPFSGDEVRRAVIEVRLVMEIIGYRYADVEGLSFPELLADGLGNHGLFVGPSIADAWDRDLDRLTLTIQDSNSALLSRECSHPDGHPFYALHWLANFLNKRKQPLRAGQIVITGSYAGVLHVPFFVPLRVSFDGLGSFDVEFVSEAKALI